MMIIQILKEVLAIIFIIAWVLRCIFGIADLFAEHKRRKAEEEDIEYWENKYDGM